MPARTSLRRFLRTPRAQVAALASRLRGNTIFARWSATDETKNNWGDAVNRELIAALSGRTPINVSEVIQPIWDADVYLVVGSILDNANVKNLVVWGSGFRHEGARLRIAPKRVTAVRGPLSRDKLIAAGIDCPAVFGDPALIMPRLYTPRPLGARYSLGIVPHYVDAGDPRVASLARTDDCNVIDVRAGTYAFVDLIAQCDYIASSSLHGVIVAHAYGIPAVWITFGSKVAGSGFKFRDYYLSTSGPVPQAVEVNSRTTVADLTARAALPALPNLDELLDKCPFRASGQS